MTHTDPQDGATVERRSERTLATERAVRVTLGRTRPDYGGIVLQVALLLCVVITLGVLAVLVWRVFSQGVQVFVDRGGGFLTSDLNSDPLKAGVWQGIKGSIILGLIVIVVSFPLGIATAVYLEEYAERGVLSRVIDVNIRNLAGVPSVVYGLLGLAVFVKVLGTDRGSGGGLTGGRSIIAGGLALAIVVLPLVIITAAEALRAVPGPIREAGYGIGMTRWEVTKHLVLPSATPGILTGTVIALSRALGETAPLLLVGAVTGVFATGNAGVVDQLKGPFTALPVVVFHWSTLPQKEFEELASAAIIVLLAITLVFNALAIWLRTRFEREW